MNWRKTITYPLICLKNGSRELSYLKDLERKQFLGFNEIQQLKMKRLKSILIFASENVPFYRKRFNRAAFDPHTFRSLAELGRIPPLTKLEIQENLDDLLAKDVKREALIKDKTGGSTGVPLVFYYSQDRFDLRRAAEMRHDRWAGYDIGDKCAVIWGARRDFGGKEGLRARLRYFLTNNKIVLDASSITDEAFDGFTKALKRFRPDFILAYARAITLYAEWLRDRNLEPYHPKAIISSAELMGDKSRELIEGVFDTRVYDRYGCREFSVIASECPEHQMHINDECLHIEFVGDDGVQVQDGEEGEILVTDLFNFAMPMIRYRIGDCGIPIAGQCKCGRGLSLMKVSMGRTSDFILTPVGRKVSGAAITAYVCTNIEGLAQAQFYQYTKGAVEVKMIKNNKFNASTLPKFKDRIKQFLDDIEVDIEVVDKIPVPESGKLQFCVNKLNLSGG